ncbi:hypothetical protein Tco_1294437 [Tanacetum coccineum]
MKVLKRSLKVLKSKEKIRPAEDEEAVTEKKIYFKTSSENDSDKENDELRLYLTIAQDDEKEVDYEILDRKYPIKEWKTECLGAKPQSNQAEHLEEINLNVLLGDNGAENDISILEMTVLSIL